MTEDLNKIRNAILVYNTETGITPDFEKKSKQLIEMNIKPIVLIFNAQRTDVDYQRIDTDISKSWGDINSELYISSPIKFYFDLDTRIAYQVKTGEEKGISELIDTIKNLKTMHFFD